MMKLKPEFCTQKLPAKFGTQLPESSGSGVWCPKIQVKGQKAILIFFISEHRFEAIRIR
jgi:hypothetical protein